MPPTTPNPRRWLVTGIAMGYALAEVLPLSVVLTLFA